MKQVSSLSLVPEQIQLSIQVEPDGLMLYADPNLIRQLLINLLKNAVQAIGNNQGRILVHAYADKDEHVFINVSNNGPAISNELARQIVKGPDKVYDKETGKWKNDYNSQYEVKGHNLGLMCEFYGIEHGELHRADVDALATGKLLVAMMNDTERVRKAKRNSRMAKDFEFDIVEHIGVLAEKTKISSPGEEQSLR